MRVLKLLNYYSKLHCCHAQIFRIIPGQFLRKDDHVIGYASYACLFAGVGITWLISLHLEIHFSVTMMITFIEFLGSRQVLYKRESLCMIDLVPCLIDRALIWQIALAQVSSTQHSYTRAKRCSSSTELPLSYALFSNENRVVVLLIVQNVPSNYSG